MSQSSKGNLAELGERLKQVVEEVQERYETFIDDTQLYKNGKLDEVSFFYKLGQYLLELSKANFLEAQLITELKGNLETKGSLHETKTPRPNASSEIYPANDKTSDSSEGTPKRNCSSCSAEISPKAKFCRSCGKPQS